MSGESKTAERPTFGEILRQTRAGTGLSIEAAAKALVDRNWHDEMTDKDRADTQSYIERRWRSLEDGESPFAQDDTEWLDLPDIAVALGLAVVPDAWYAALGRLPPDLRRLAHRPRLWAAVRLALTTAEPAPGRSQWRAVLADGTAVRVTVDVDPAGSPGSNYVALVTTSSRPRDPVPLARGSEEAALHAAFQALWTYPVEVCRVEEPSRLELQREVDTARRGMLEIRESLRGLHAAMNARLGTALAEAEAKHRLVTELTPRTDPVSAEVPAVLQVAQSTTEAAVVPERYRVRRCRCPGECAHPWMVLDTEKPWCAEFASEPEAHAEAARLNRA